LASRLYKTNLTDYYESIFEILNTIKGLAGI